MNVKIPAPPLDASPNLNSVTANDSVSALTKLSDAQVFSRDPEDYSAEDIAETITRLQRIVARQRKARADDAEIQALTAKIKKANAAKKPRKKNLMETQV
jgi:hypothetical protein